MRDMPSTTDAIANGPVWDLFADRERLTRSERASGGGPRAAGGPSGTENDLLLSADRLRMLSSRTAI